MKIICPECRFTREVPDEKIPSTSVNATCPQCGTRFHFRKPDAPVEDAAQTATAVPDGSQPSAAEPRSMPEAAPYASDKNQDSQGKPSDIWQRLDDLGKARPDRPRENGSYSFADAPSQRETVAVPFEDMEHFGFFDGIWETIKRAMRHPDLFFGALPLNRPRARALIFYILLGELSYLALTIWDAAGLDPMQLLMNEAPPTGDAEFYTSLGGQLSFMIILPVFYIGYLYISTGILHLALRLFRAAESGFEATLRVNCYASAASILYVLPLAGMVVGSVWQLASLIIGLKAIHQTGYVRIFAALGSMVLAVILLATAAQMGIPPDPQATM